MSDSSDLFPDKRPDLTSIFKRLELVGADTRITVGLLSIEARRAAGQKNGDCIRELYDLYAVELLNVGATENDTALDEDIPVTVFRLAVDRKWIQYPPVRPLKVVGNLLEGWYTQKRYEFVPRELLTEMFAGYSVTAGYGVEFKKFLEPRIAHWRAELAKQSLLKASGRERPDANLNAPLKSQPEFPGRAKWLRDRLRERSWDHNKPNGFGGPDRKTVLRMLGGHRVSEDSLYKIVLALNKKKINAEIKLLDIPND
jgi:hypothetical protein